MAGGGAGKYKTVSVCAQFFKTPRKWGFLSCQNDTLKKDFSMLFSQIWQFKGGFAQTWTSYPKIWQDSWKKYPSSWNDCFWYPKCDPLNSPSNQKKKKKRKKERKKPNPNSPFSWSRMLSVLYLTVPLLWKWLHRLDTIIACTNVPASSLTKTFLYYAFVPTYPSLVQFQMVEREWYRVYCPSYCVALMKNNIVCHVSE